MLASDLLRVRGPSFPGQASAAELRQRHVDRIWSRNDLQAQDYRHRAGVRVPLFDQLGDDVYGGQAPPGAVLRRLRREGPHGKAPLRREGQRHQLSVAHGSFAATVDGACSLQRDRRQHPKDRQGTERDLPRHPEDEQDGEALRPGDQDPGSSSKGSETGALRLKNAIKLPALAKPYS